LNSSFPPAADALIVRLKMPYRITLDAPAGIQSCGCIFVIALAVGVYEFIGVLPAIPCVEGCTPVVGSESLSRAVLGVLASDGPVVISGISDCRIAAAKWARKRQNKASLLNRHLLFSFVSRGLFHLLPVAGFLSFA